MEILRRAATLLNHVQSQNRIPEQGIMALCLPIIAEQSSLLCLSVQTYPGTPAKQNKPLVHILNLLYLIVPAHHICLFRRAQESVAVPDAWPCLALDSRCVGLGPLIWSAAWPPLALSSP